MSALVRVVEVRGAFDRRHQNPAKNYGIHGMDLRFVLRGPEGAVQFVVYTGMHLPSVAEELWGDRHNRDYNPFEPMGADIGYHALAPQYEGQASMECEYVPGGRCYYDGSSLAAVEFMPEFLSGGSGAVWAMLEQKYESMFGSRRAS